MNINEFKKKYPHCKCITYEPGALFTFWEEADVYYDPCKKEWLPNGINFPIIIPKENYPDYLDTLLNELPENRKIEL
jgi:hypothetical protein